MKNWPILCLFCVVFLFCLNFLYSSYGFVFFVKDHQVIKLALKKNFFAAEKQELLVEVVKTRESITKGLSLREDLVSFDGQKLDGLLFIFPKSNIQSFWMKDMLFNIDICWLNDLTFIACERNAKLPVLGEELKIYKSPKLIDTVLETKPDQLSDQELKLKLFFKWR